LFFLCRSLSIGRSLIFLGEIPENREKVPKLDVEMKLKLSAPE
jgi:hypothetical protein